MNNRVHAVEQISGGIGRIPAPFPALTCLAAHQTDHRMPARAEKGRQRRPDQAGGTCHRDRDRAEPVIGRTRMCCQIRFELPVSIGEHRTKHRGRHPCLHSVHDPSVRGVHHLEFMSMPPRQHSRHGHGGRTAGGDAVDKPTRRVVFTGLVSGHPAQARRQTEHRAAHRQANRPRRATRPAATVVRAA